MQASDTVKRLFCVHRRKDFLPLSKIKKRLSEPRMRGGATLCSSSFISLETTSIQGKKEIFSLNRGLEITLGGAKIGDW